MLPDRQEEISRNLDQAQTCLREAQEHFARRRGRKVMEVGFLACFHAASALWLASGLYAGAGHGPGPGEMPSFGPGGKSLAAFYQQFANAKRRLENDSETYVNIEEAANWLRLAAWFVERMAKLALRQGVR